MRIVNLNTNEFTEFANNHPLRNYCQTIEYAKVMSDMGYTYDLIGYKDDSNNLVGASLILKKKIGTFAKYVYAPKGVLVDYYKTEILKIFIKDLNAHYRRKGYSFMKINPEIIIGEINKKSNYSSNYNQNVSIIGELKNMGFKRRREIYPLDFMFPRINPYINLKKYAENEEIREIMSIANENGLNIEVMNKKDLDVLFDIASKDSYQSISYYKSILNHFDSAELILVKANYEQCLINARERYNKELENNNYYNELIQTDNSDDTVNKKMQSDKDLLKYKNQVVDATAGLKYNKFKYVGGVVIVKYQNRVSIVLEDYDNDNVYAQYYLYNYLIETFKSSYDFIELNGLSSDFSDQYKYFDFNKVKLDFDPVIYEFIGVLNALLFKKIQSKGLLSKEFLPSHKFE